MNNEQKKPAEELSEKELEGIVGGRTAHAYLEAEDQNGFLHTAQLSRKPRPEFPVD